MDTIEIPAATFVSEAVVICGCVLVAVGILAWGVPKFKFFLSLVFRRAQHRTKTIHLVLGLLVYALVFAPVLIATFFAVGIATARPTVISSEGVVGVDWACSSDLEVLPFSCVVSLNSWAKSRQMIRWEQIDDVGCISRNDGTIRDLYVHAGPTQISIGSLGVHDLSVVRQVVIAHAPKGVVEPCR